MSEDLSVEDMLQMDRACDAFETALKAGDVPPIENFLNPQDRLSHVLAADLIHLAVEYVRQRPELASSLRAPRQVEHETVSHSPIVWTLNVETGPNRGITMPLTASRDSFVGRDVACEIALVDDMACSRRHARVWQVGCYCLVEDLNSKNGLYFTGKRVNRLIVAPDDLIYLGHSTIRFCLATSPSVAAG